VSGPRWWEMLRLRLLPRVPSRITMTDRTKWAAVEKAFRSGSAQAAHVHHAATFLLFDAWLFVTRSIQSPAESPFLALARLTQSIDAPELRVAHCLRDIAYGHEGAEAELRALMRSQDPATHRMFQEALVSYDGPSQGGGRHEISPAPNPKDSRRGKKRRD